MANANTVVRVAGTPAVALNTTTETILTAAGAPIQVGFSNQSNFNGFPFVVRLRGTATGGTTTLTFKLYLASADTIGTSTAVASWTAAANVPAAGGNFDVQATFIWDAVSQTLTGTVGGQVNGTITAAAAAAGATSVASVSALQFVVSAKFSAAAATNTVTVSELLIDQS